MKIITAFVEPNQLAQVTALLDSLHLEAITTEAAEITTPTPHGGTWRGSQYSTKRTAALRLEVPYWDADADAEATADRILAAALDGRDHHRGAVWVSDASYHGDAVGSSLARMAHPANVSH